MKLACLLGRHAARPNPIRNQGLSFSRCRHCARDMVRSRGRWRRVPKGFRVVWRGAAEPAAGAAGLPVPTRASRSVADALSQLVALTEMAAAGLRAMAWRLGDGVAAIRRRPLFQRRPALLRLPAP